MPRLEPGEGDPETWAKASVILPAGWEAIQIDRLWVRGRAMRLEACHGEVTRLTPIEEGRR